MSSSSTDINEIAAAAQAAGMTVYSTDMDTLTQFVANRLTELQNEDLPRMLEACNKYWDGKSMLSVSRFDYHDIATDLMQEVCLATRTLKLRTYEVAVEIGRGEELRQERENELQHAEDQSRIRAKRNKTGAAVIAMPSGPGQHQSNFRSFPSARQSFEQSRINSLNLDPVQK